jgi:O-antigen biosynthesis protein
MKKIKIVGLLTHFKMKKKSTGEEYCLYSGVDYVRLILPLRYLPKDEFETDITYEVTDPVKFTQDHDIIYSSYIDTDYTYVVVKVNAINNHCVWVMDLDDNIWDVSSNHPLKSDFTEGSPVLKKETLILKDASNLTCTSSYLRYKMVENLKKDIKDIKVIPNFIDLTDYDYKKIKPIKHEGVQISYMGGSSHYDDVNKPEFIKAMKIIMEKYPDTTFRTSFYMPQLKAHFGYRYKYSLGRYNINSFINEVWPRMAGEADIFVAPLSWNNYSRAKSYIKYLEYSAAKIPCIMESIDPYNEVLQGSDGRGFLASSTEDWVNRLSYLIENPKTRKEIGENAYKYVKENHTIQKNAYRYAEYFKEVLGIAKS